MLSVFKAPNYKAFLQDALSPTGMGRGTRIRLAEHLGCAPAFISRVLHHPKADFSLEQGVRICEFLKLTEEEQEFFLLLLGRARAGSKALEAHYARKIRRILEAREKISATVDASSTLSIENQIRYYSSWQYAAIHAAVACEEYRTEAALAEGLALPRKRVVELLRALVAMGLLRQEGARYLTTQKRGHLDSASPLIGTLHQQWRQKAADAAGAPAATDLHYSGAITFGESELPRLREILLTAIADVERTLKTTGDERVFGIGMDFFDLIT